MKKITFYSTLLITLLSLFAFKNSLVDIDLIKIQGGTFKMGSKDSDGLADVDEQKEHTHLRLANLKLQYGNGNNSSKLTK